MSLRLCLDEHLGLQPALEALGFRLGRSASLSAGGMTWTLLHARHADGRVLWCAYQCIAKLPFKSYITSGTYRLAGYRHYETERIAGLMALSDAALRRRGVQLTTLLRLLMVSAWLVHPQAIAALVDGEASDSAYLVPPDFEATWRPTSSCG